MTLIDDTLKVAKKTHIEGIRWWLKQSGRRGICPMAFKMARGSLRCRYGWRMHPVCVTLFPEVKDSPYECPCSEYSEDYVARRARELVKAWEEK